jgi:hypothetical protein
MKEIFKIQLHGFSIKHSWKKIYINLSYTDTGEFNLKYVTILMLIDKN